MYKNIKNIARYMRRTIFLQLGWTQLELPVQLNWIPGPLKKYTCLLDIHDIIDRNVLDHIAELLVSEQRPCKRVPYILSKARIGVLWGYT